MQKLSSYISAGLQDKTKLLHRLTLSLRMQLPEALARHCWVASLDNRTLTIITDDPGQASLLRYQQYEILKQLNQELGLASKEYLNRLKIKIRKAVNQPKRPGPAKPLSEQGARHIRECAEHMQDDDLKEALHHLARQNRKD